MVQSLNLLEVSEQLKFLKDWGSIFRQSFTDNPTRTYFNAHYKTCVDAYQKLSKKKSCFNTDLEVGLRRLEDYFLFLEKQGKDEKDYKRSQFVAAIKQLITEPQLSLFKGQTK